MKTPYIAGRVQSKVKQAEADDCIQELQTTIVRDRINHRADLRKLEEKYKRELAEADDRVQDLQTAYIGDRINYRADLRKLEEKYKRKLDDAHRHIVRLVKEKDEALRCKRWYMVSLRFLFLLIGMILGTALALYNLQ